MFKNLKEKLATQVNKTNQTLFSGLSSPDSVSISKDSDTRTPSVTSREDNLENNRSRLDSASSDISQFSVGQNPNSGTTYVSPPRHFMPPSDIESEYGGDESDHEANTKMIKLQKLLSIQKNKFNQLKNAYDEVEREKENIKNILQQHQDAAIKRHSELRDQIKLDRQAKEQLECLYQKEIRKRENRIEELTLQVNAQKDLIQLPTQTDHEEIQNLRDKNSKLEALLNRCKDAMHNHQEKQSELTKTRDELLQQLNEKQTVIESLMKVNSKGEDHFSLKHFVKNIMERHADDNISSTSTEVQDHFDSDISVLLQDKQRLQEELEGLNHRVQQMENELVSTRKENGEFQKQIEILRQDSSDLNLILSNQQMKITHFEEELKQTREIIVNIENILPTNSSASLIERVQELLNKQSTDDEVNQLKLQVETSKEQLSTIEEELKAAFIRSEDKIKDLNSQIHQRKEEIDRLNAVNSTLNQRENEIATIDEMKAANAEISMKYQQIEKELEGKQNEIIQLKETNTTINDERERVQTQLDEKQAEVAGLNSVIDELKAGNAETNNKYQQIESELDEKRNYIVNLSSSANEFKLSMNNEHEQIRNQLADKENETARLTTTINQLREDNETVKEQFEARQNEVVHLTAVIAELKAASAEIHMKYQQIEKELEEKQNQIINLSSTTDEIKLTMSNEHEQIQNELIGKENQIVQLSTTLKEMRDKNDTISQKCEHVEKELKVKQTEIDRLKGHLEKAKAANEKRKQTEVLLEEKQNEIAQLRISINEVKANNITITNEHEQLRETIQKLKQSQNSDQQLLQERDKQIEILKQNLSSSEQQLHSQRSQFDSHQDTIEHLRKELHESESRLDHSFDEQNQLSQSFLRLQNVLGVDATNHDELVDQLVHKMEQFQLLKDDSERLNNDLTKQKSEQINLHNELHQLEQQFDENKEELNRTKQDSLTNKTKYENQILQFNQSIEQIQNEKHSIEIQYENLQRQFNDRVHQYDQLQSKFEQFSIEKDEQLSKYEKDLHQQQSLNDNLRREFNDLQDELKSKSNEILSLQTNLNKCQQTLQSKIDQLSQEKLSLTEENQRQEKIVFQQKQLTDNHTALEEKYNQLLTDKAGLENELDTIRVQMQTTESKLNKKKQDQSVKFEQSEKIIKELQTERDSIQSEMEVLRDQIIALTRTNEENTRCIAEFDSEKINFEQENLEKDRQILERDEKLQELQLNLDKTQESGAKLRKALHKMKETITNNEQTHSQESEIRIRMMTEEYEQKLQEQEAEYSANLKSVTKELSSQIEEKEQQFNQQLQELINKSYQIENHIQQRIADAEQRAVTAEEQLKEKSTNSHFIEEYENQIHILQTQLEHLNIPIPTTDHSSQTIIENPSSNHSQMNSTDSLHSFVIEPTEIDYLKQIILAYMTGTDRMTMAKVICALLRYTDDEKSLIIEQEKLRQARWLNTSR